LGQWLPLATSSALSQRDQPLRYPMTAPIASGWSNIAGWDSHPPGSAAFARRTPEQEL